jgi:uncharacterized membrane protein HdeD (DUF308 family)
MTVEISPLAILIIAVLFVGSAVLTGWVAARKGRDGPAYFLLGLVSPLISLIVILFAPSLVTVPSDGTNRPV